MKVFMIALVLVFYLSTVCNGESESVAAPMAKAEQETLYSTIQSFVGKWWNGSDLYPDPCGWTPIQGVSCDLSSDGLWYVTSLNIGPVQDNSLNCAPKVEFSPRLFDLKHLQSLSFFNCFVSSHHPVTIPTDKWEALANTLESLELRSNPGLVGSIPAIFGGFKHLQSLVLIENGLRGEIPISIGSLSNLKRLVLSDNRLTGKIPDSLGSLNGLLILDLSRNSLSGPLPSSLGALVSLLKLDLSYNNLTGNIEGGLGNLKDLTLLDLSHNKFSGGLTKSLGEMSSLEELVLSSNPIGGDLMSFDWKNLRGLMVLDVSNMNLTGGIPNSISELKRLRYLGLNDNNLAGEIPLEIASLPNISAVYLNGNNLTGELKFSEWFYGKMGRRFGAWNNTNLCYPNGLMPTSHVPFGVKPCQQEEKITTLHENVELGGVSMASLGVSNYANYGSLGHIVLMEIFMVLVILDSYYVPKFTWWLCSLNLAFLSLKVDRKRNREGRRRKLEAGGDQRDSWGNNRTSSIGMAIYRVASRLPWSKRFFSSDNRFGVDKAVAELNKEMEFVFGDPPPSSLAGSGYNPAMRATLHNSHDQEQEFVENTYGSTLTHVDSKGEAQMVDVSLKEISKRVARASCKVLLGKEVFSLVSANQIEKGDVLSVAKIAGICGAKQTSSLIPLCHNINLTNVHVDLSLNPVDFSVDIEGEAASTGKTGVEMEALTAVSVAGLTVYDMCKAASKHIQITNVQLEHKTGGKSGEWSRQNS
ncbi:OLC1v1032418C1 [Oldenlandia corymbosa var. corymbosa]|uniref:cyclic pyranopterin monophosphate synthase n=1 Tax=Oldenlandia corymbosa var. corymbosa TaxID=529605 RepID=A0AAV1CNW6_OLDCO|nr:OLC1v1032418C1 [Oldenlandia corymbosa var. corymbosa]